MLSPVRFALLPQRKVEGPDTSPSGRLSDTGFLEARHRASQRQDDSVVASRQRGLRGVARPGAGAGGFSMTQRTCVGGKITPVQPQSGDGLDAGGDSDG